MLTQHRVRILDRCESAWRIAKGNTSCASRPWRSTDCAGRQPPIDAPVLIQTSRIRCLEHQIPLARGDSMHHLPRPTARKSAARKEKSNDFSRGLVRERASVPGGLVRVNEVINQHVAFVDQGMSHRSILATSSSAGSTFSDLFTESRNPDELRGTGFYHLAPPCRRVDIHVLVCASLSPSNNYRWVATKLNEVRGR